LGVVAVARAHPVLSRYLVAVLERVTRCYTLPDQDKPDMHLDHWEAWVKDNKDRLYRPPGALRFQLREPPKASEGP